MEADGVKDRLNKVRLMIAATFITIVLSVVLLLIPMPDQNLVKSLIQMLLPLFCMFLTIKLYFFDEDKNIRFISSILSVALLIWTLSNSSWYLLYELIKPLHLGWIARDIGTIGWVASYCLIVYGLFKLKNSKQWFLNTQVNWLINIVTATVAIIFVTWALMNTNWSGKDLQDTWILTGYIILDMFIFSMFMKLFLMNLKVSLKYLIMSVFGFCFLNFAGDLSYLISYLGEPGFFASARYFIADITYSVSMIFLSSTLLIYTTNDIREKALGSLSKKLKDTTLAMENIVMQSPDAMCVFDTDGKPVLVNDNFLSLFDLKRSDVASHLNLSMMPGKITGISTDTLAKLREGKNLVIPSAKLATASQGKTSMMVKLFPILNSDNRISNYAIALDDITERVKLEHNLKESLEEKEILLKEIHHRVKNNLQIIYSLLSIQAGFIKDQQSLDAFKETQNRVMSMALIHEKLYQSKDLAKIDFAEYIQTLSSQIMRTYSTGRNVTLNISVDQVRMGVDTAVPCGLIINEMISNSMKHAFPDGRYGNISIDLHELPGNGVKTYRLKVKDNGIGLPANFDINNATSLGMVLITSLTGQLNGKMEIKSTEGTEYLITFQETGN